MTYLKIKDRYVYLTKSLEIGLQKALALENNNKQFQKSATFFLKEILEKDEGIFNSDFENIDLWDVEAKSELLQILKTCSKVNKSFIVKHIQENNSIVLLEKEYPTRFERYFNLKSMPNFEISISPNAIYNISGSLDGLFLFFPHLIIYLGSYVRITYLNEQN